MLSRNAILSSRLASALISRGRLPFVAVEAVGAVSRRCAGATCRPGMAMRRVPQAKRAERARLLRQRIDSSLVQELRISLAARQS